jgi:3-deoxy-D-arabino-heptulosonate 7-phosphate (DAHP) synthase
MEIEKLVLPGIDASERPIIIAGPCSAESREQVLNTAQELAKNGVKIFRAGIWKPRTKPGGFEGMGTAGLVGPLAAFADMSEAGTPAGLLIIKIVLLYFIAPAAISLTINHLLGKTGLIKPGDMKLAQ